MSIKQKTAAWSNSKHRWLALVGGISLLLWSLSGLSHVAMVLFGPQQVQFMPPGAEINLSGASPIATTLAGQGIAAALAVKTVPAPDGAALWQVTETPMAPRRYFRPADGTEIADGDRRQAEFLARHYLATDREIRSTTLQTEFDAAYPWVNRLLPVWRVEFAGDDGLTAYVHTETSALAAVNNTTKSRLMAVFGTLHTWEWMPENLDWLRVPIIAIMVGSLLALAVTGVMMLIAIRRKKRLPGSRGWHRAMGYVLALPLIMFSTSGIYHLVQSALVPPMSQLKMGLPVAVANGAWPVEADWDALSRNRNIVSVALVAGGKGQPLYRLGLAPAAPAGGGAHDHGGHDHGAAMTAPVPRTDAEIREARFTGLKPDGPAIYIDAATGTPAPDGDRAIALAMAQRFLGATDSAPTSAELVTRFSDEYDFRNKRLPVWRVDYGAPVRASLFVDPASGVLVDKVNDWEKPERFVFSMVHKWNFLFPLGRLGLNGTVAAFVIALVLFMALIGLNMDLKSRFRRSGRQGSVSAPQSEPTV
ncbi:MAG: PepSY domain-containing protein [Polymorphobacter sp.]|uniref:PepSY domain-containing protein n=1 Tax=Polymorphobacter sp. TaxID=1909290 RepID=UPI003A87E131